MKNTESLILKLDSLSIKVSLKDNNLEVKSYKNKLTKEIIEEIKLNKLSLINFLEMENNLSKKNIKRGKIQQFYPLSSAQRRLWAICQFNDANLAYNMPGVFVFEGDLNIENLEKSFQKIISRHEILRTVFRNNEEGEICQFIKDIEEFKFIIDYVNLLEAPEILEIKNKVKALVDTELEQPFDLSLGPLLRAKLILIEKNKHLFIFTMHHIISDGWSINNISNELIMFYNSLENNIENPLHSLKFQYCDYAIWQKQLINDKSMVSHEEFWLSEFADEIPVLELPFDYKRPKFKTYNGTVCKKIFNYKIKKNIIDICKEYDVTQFMFLLGLIDVMLYRYTGQEDFIIGTPIAGRDNFDLDNQVGFYLNMLPLKMKLDKNDSFVNVLKKIKVQTINAYKHQDYPFDEIIDKLKYKRDISRSPLFDVTVQLQNLNGKTSISNANKFSNINVYGYEVEENIKINSKFDINFHFVELENEFELRIEYNTDLFKPETIDRMGNHLKRLTKSIINNVNKSINQLNYLESSEKYQLLVNCNNTELDYPKDKTLVDLFEEIVKKFPEKEALKDDYKSFSYFELNKLSTLIAEYLITNYGEDDKSPIAVLLGRSANMVAVLLGILKCGRSYIPLDPTFPKERLSYIVTNSQTQVLISEKDYELEVIDSLTILSLESILDRIDEFSGTFSKTISSKDTAYIIYTSGSTGNPKGVEIQHQSLLNFLTSIQQKPGVSFKDILFSVTTYSFDISILEFFAPLISGATLYIANHEVLSDPNLIIQKIEEIQPSIIQATPSFYQMLFNADWFGNKRLKVLCGGDLLSEALAEKLIDHSLEVWNMYGPTETTIWSSIKKIGKPKDASNIGKPINNTKFYIVDDFLNLMPIGITGKIYIGGDGLAKGYYKNESLTKEKFIFNPYLANEKIYDTGDLGKWIPDGNIEFLGRKDYQVKIRGYRIELGEIEVVLLQYSENIKQTVLDVKEVNGEKVLVAYVVSNKIIDKLKLRDYLQKKLPEYMVPTFYVELEVLPLTPTGKINRKALPDISEEDFIRKQYVAPRNEIELKLVEIWKDVLGVETIGITDDFFELGGHSLKAIKVWSKLNHFIGFDVKLSDIYNFSTIQQFSNLKANKSSLIRFNSSINKHNPSIFFVPPIIGVSSIFKDLTEEISPFYNCFGLDYSGINNNENLFISIEDAAERFCSEIIRENLDVNSELFIFGYSMGGSIAFEIVKILENSFNNVKLILIESYVNTSNNQFEMIDLNFNMSSVPKFIHEFAEEYQLEINENIENYIINNYKIFNNYYQSGCIKSAIQLFQIRESPQCMLAWEKFTLAGIEIDYVEGSHWKIMSSQNIKIITEYLLKTR